MWSLSLNEYRLFDYLWWKDWVGSGEGSVFWRPIPSLIFEGSVRLFGENAFPLHLLLILIHGGVAAGLYLLIHKLTDRHWLALLASIFFITCEDHSMMVGWISAFTGPLAVFFITLALLGHTLWLKHRRPMALVASLLMLILSMACKETASVAPIAIVLLTFFMPNGTAENYFAGSKLRNRISRFIKDPLSWIPALLILAIYLVMYSAMGSGTISGLTYVSPFVDPVKYLSHLVAHLPVMWLGTFSPIPPFITMFFPEMLLFAAVAGAVIFIVWLVALWPFRYTSLILWALILYIISLLPEMAADANERGLYFAMVPAGILMASVVLTIGPLVRWISEKPFASARWTRFIGWVALLGILVPGILLSTISPWAYLPGLIIPEKELRTALPYIEHSQPEHVLILNTSGFMLTLYTWDILNYHSERSLDVWLLSSAYGVFSLEKAGDSSFVIRTDRAGWLNNLFARLIRTKSVFKPGDCYQTPLFAATVLKTTTGEKDVLNVRFDFKSALDNPGWLFLRWNGNSFEPLDIFALQTQEIVELGDTSELWKSLF